MQDRNEWKFFAALPKADAALTAAWWAVLLLRGTLSVAFALAMGALVVAVQRDAGFGAPLGMVGVVFVLLQVLTPLHTAIGANLGDKTAAWLYDRLMDACVRPPGIGHLENPTLAADLTVARDFDLGMTGPPLNVALDFIAGGLVMSVSGFASALVLFRFTWWAPLVLGAAWLATHYLLRESSVWFDRNTDEVRLAQRDADYAFNLAVDPPACKELRVFGLGDWAVDRFVTQRTRLHELQYHATRLRERPLAWSLLIALVANVAVFAALAIALADGRITLGDFTVDAFCAVGTSAIAFGGLNWALDGAAAPVAAVMRLEQAMAPAGALRIGRLPAGQAPTRHIQFKNVTFAYPGSAPVLDGFDLVIPAGSSLAIVGQNGAGKTTMAKLLCRLYDPQGGSIEVDGVDIRDLDVVSWRTRIAAVFQDFVKFELPLRDNVAPSGAPDETIRASLDEAGASMLATLDTVLARGYDGGTDLSGGQWQRVALARALCAVKNGAHVVLLDEPTAQLDVRGEAEIFERLLAATRQSTTILISHRFSTVRLADRICVLEHGKVVEVGSHDELIAKGGRYKTMFDLQAQRFGATEDEEGKAYDVLA